MTRDDIIRMAQDSGLTYAPQAGWVVGSWQRLERFANLVAEHERAALAEPESINNAAVKLLMRAEVEMRYAGWAEYISDNPSRSYAYHDIAAFLTACANGNKAALKEKNNG